MDKRENDQSVVDTGSYTMAAYRYPTSPNQQRRRSPPDLTVDFARQMSINSEAEIAAALEQQAHHHHHRQRALTGPRNRRLLDRRHSLAAMAPQLPSAGTDGRLVHRRLNVGPIRSASSSRSAEQLLQPTPPARSRSPVTNSGRTAPAAASATATTTPVHQRDRLSVSGSSSNNGGAGPDGALRAHSHHGRSQSVRTPKRPATAAASSSSSSATHQYPPSTPSGRPRGTSLPSRQQTAKQSAQAGSEEGGGEEEADYYLLRHFIVQQGSNRVVNRGDSFRRAVNNRTARPSQQYGGSSQHSSASSISTENQLGSPPHQQPYSDASHQSSSSSRRASLLNHDLVMMNPGNNSYGGNGHQQQQEAEPLRVLMLGASGVGKTALTVQFMTSEYINTYEASLDDDSTCDRTVSVLLDGEESQLVFIDHPHGEISVENCMSTYNPHAYVIVYSVVDLESAAKAESILQFLWCNSATSVTRASITTTNMPPSPPVILVANKIDLVRSRVVSSQAGKSLAMSFDCKYIETSSGMQHNVDELLVGILKQIRLKMKVASSGNHPQEGEGCASSARSLFRKRSAGRHHRGHQTTHQTGLTAEDAGNNNRAGGRRSTSLRVRRMLGKVWPNCADYYHNKSKSCEDLHVL